MGLVFALLLFVGVLLVGFDCDLAFRLVLWLLYLCVAWFDDVVSGIVVIMTVWGVYFFYLVWIRFVTLVSLLWLVGFVVW